MYGYLLITAMSMGKIKFPSYRTVNSEKYQLIDFEHLTSYILGLDKEQISKSISYTCTFIKKISGDSFDYWDAVFDNEIIDVQVSLSQAKFCFNYK